jgi:flagellar motor switch protein FliN
MLSVDLAAEVVAACQAGASEASAALSRALDRPFTLAPLAPQPLDLTPLAGPGLLIVLHVAGQGAVLAIPESSGLLPAWYAAPDATGASKLATLAQELGMLLLPESCLADDFAALHVGDLAAALLRGAPAAAATMLGLSLTGADTAAQGWLLWPVAQPAALADPQPAAPAQPAAATAPAASAARPHLKIQGEPLEEALPLMPKYTRSLLKIRVPIVVTLAKSQQPLSRIVELAPGSIIPFAKSCDDTLSLEVNNREVAVGEAVKVGDKFGLRITSMLLPPERFLPLAPRQRG